MTKVLLIYNRASSLQELLLELKKTVTRTDIKAKTNTFRKHILGAILDLGFYKDLWPWDIWSKWRGDTGLPLVSLSRRTTTSSSTWETSQLKAWRRKPSTAASCKVDLHAKEGLQSEALTDYFSLVFYYNHVQEGDEFIHAFPLSVFSECSLSQHHCRFINWTLWPRFERVSKRHTSSLDGMLPQFCGFGGHLGLRGDSSDRNRPA